MSAAQSVSSAKKSYAWQIFILLLLHEENLGLICRVFQARATEVTGFIQLGLVLLAKHHPANRQGSSSAGEERQPRKKEPSSTPTLLSKIRVGVGAGGGNKAVSTLLIVHPHTLALSSFTIPSASSLAWLSDHVFIFSLTRLNRRGLQPHLYQQSSCLQSKDLGGRDWVS